MFLEQIYDACLAQYAYLIGCQATGDAIVIDPERDIDRYLEIAGRHGLKIVGVAETHIHADFLSGARELAEHIGATLYLSDEGKAAGWESKWAKDAGYDVTLLHEGDWIQIGNVRLKVIKTPGHTPEHISYLVYDFQAEHARGILSGDFLFVGDVGRPDLLETAAKQVNTMEASARVLFKSVQHLLNDKTNDHLVVWPAHGAGSSCGKGLGAVPQSSVGYEKSENSALIVGRSGEQAFVDYILKDQPEPPMYFARMKQWNRDGVPVLGHLPQPARLSHQELAIVLEEGEWVPIDTRGNRQEFLSQHLPGSLYVPFSSSFCTGLGSVVEDPATPLLLVGAPEHEEELVRRCVRLGYDRIMGFVSQDTLDRYFDADGPSSSIATTHFPALGEYLAKGAQVLDVRYRNEFEEGHISGAIHAPYTRIPEEAKGLSKQTPLVVHCRSGHRATIASSYLQRQGYDVTAIIDSVDRAPID